MKRFNESKREGNTSLLHKMVTYVLMMTNQYFRVRNETMKTLKEHMDYVEKVIEPFALRNTEADYELARILVRVKFGRIPLTNSQVTRVVNRVWDRVHMTKEVVA